MPGFFDFSAFNPVEEMNPAMSGQNTPLMDSTEQMGNYDFMSNLPQDMPEQPSQGVPYNALAAMQGIQMPQMPQQDAMGRYGVTDEQYGDAGRQSLASILRGAAGTMFNDRPDDVLKAAAGSGDIRRGALDKASLENMNAFKLQVEAKAKELDFISKKSDIQKQQMQMEAEAMKLEDLKLKRQVAIQWGKEMAPVMSNTLKKTAAMYGPEKADSTKAGFLNAQAKLALGDIDGATMVYEATIKDLPFEWQKQAHEDMLKATQLAANKVGIGLETAKLPDFVSAVTAAQGRIDIGDDGMPKVVTKSEIEIENLRKQQLQASIAAERAQKAAYERNDPKGALTQGALMGKVAEIDEAVRQLSVPVPAIADPAKDYEVRLNRSKLEGVLAPLGISAQQWSAMNNDQKNAAVAGVAYGKNAGAAAPQGGGVVPGGLPGTNPGQVPESVAMARKAFVDAARLGDKEKDAAIQRLVSSGDQAIMKALEAAKLDPRFAGKKKGEANVADLYSFLAGKVNVTR